MLNRRKSIVGLDVGTNEIKAVELTRVGDSLRITGFGWSRVTPSSNMSEIIQDVLRKAGIRTRHVVSAVSGRSVIVRYINLPAMTDEELKTAIRYEADKYIPFDIDEVAVDGQKLEEFQGAMEGEKEMKVLLVAVKKSLIQEHVSMIQEAGLTPVCIDVDSFALGNAFELRTLNSPKIGDGDEIVALVDIGASKTNISILKGNTTYFSREVYLGGNDLTEAVARHLTIEATEAEELKRNPHGREMELEEALLPSLDDLANEVHLSFDYFENQFDREVGDVYLSGGCVHTPGLTGVMERVFERKVHIWDATGCFELRGENIDPEELRLHAPQLPIAVGLGARILDMAR